MSGLPEVLRPLWIYPSPRAYPPDIHWSHGISMVTALTSAVLWVCPPPLGMTDWRWQVRFDQLVFHPNSDLWWGADQTAELSLLNLFIIIIPTVVSDMAALMNFIPIKLWIWKWTWIIIHIKCLSKHLRRHKMVLLYSELYFYVSVEYWCGAIWTFILTLVWCSRVWRIIICPDFLRSLETLNSPLSLFLLQSPQTCNTHTQIPTHTAANSAPDPGQVWAGMAFLFLS